MKSIQSQVSDAQRIVLELLNMADSGQISYVKSDEDILAEFKKIVDTFRYRTESISTNDPDLKQSLIIRKLFDREIQPHEAAAAISGIWTDFLNRTRCPGEPVVKPNKYRSEQVFNII